MNNIYTNSKNLNSVLIYSGDQSGFNQSNGAAYLLSNRLENSYLSDYGYLKVNSSNEWYWTKYPDILYKDTKMNFSKMKDLFEEGNSYLNRHYNVNGTTSIVGVENSNNVIVSRYCAEYSYQNNLDNIYSNSDNYAAEDINNFLMSLNYQGFNKGTQYIDGKEVTSIRIGAKTFSWHEQGETAYTFIEEEAKMAYVCFSYSNTNTYTNLNFYTEEEKNSYFEGNSYMFLSYFEYKEIIEQITKKYQYQNDDFYTYIRQEYEPIIDTLESSIKDQLVDYEEKYGNNEDIYTYYMYDFKVDLPMTITTKSFGDKKSIFMVRYNSEYDHLYDDTINLTFNASSGSELLTLSAYNAGIGALRKDTIGFIEGLEDAALEENEVWNPIIGESLTDENIISILNPSNVKELDISKYAIGDIDLTNTGWVDKQTPNMTSIVIGSQSVNENITKVLGLNDLENLEYIDLQGLSNLSSTPAINNLNNLHIFKAANSNIETFKPANNVSLYYVSLPETIKSLNLNNITFEKKDFALFGEATKYDGSFNYNISDNLVSVSLLNISDNEFTLSFVKAWMDVLNSANNIKPKSLIYLDLQGINWYEDIDITHSLSVEEIKDMFEFDINNLTGTILVKGSGNYGMLTRKEYMDITNLYGLNAFTNSISTDKVYKNLTLHRVGECFQKYEYIFTLENNGESLEKYEFYHLASDDLNNNSSILAVNSILEKISGQTIHFVNDKHMGCMTYDLGIHIDTTDTLPTSKVECGDLVLYNGDTIMLFYKDIPANNVYQYIKLGHLFANKTTGAHLSDDITKIKSWLQNNDIANIKFVASEKPETINEMTIVDDNGNEVTKDSPILLKNEGDNNIAYINIRVDNEIDYEEAPFKVLNDNQEFKVTKVPSRNGEYVTYKIELSTAKKNDIIYDSENYTFKIELNLDIEDSNGKNVGNWIYKLVYVTIESSLDKSGITENGIIVIDESTTFVDGILTIDDSIGKIENGILILE